MLQAILCHLRLSANEIYSDLKQTKTIYFLKKAYISSALESQNGLGWEGS